MWYGIISFKGWWVKEVPFRGFCIGWSCVVRRGVGGTWMWLKRRIRSSRRALLIGRVIWRREGRSEVAIFIIIFHVCEGSCCRWFRSLFWFCIFNDERWIFLHARLCASFTWLIPTEPTVVHVVTFISQVYCELRTEL